MSLLRMLGRRLARFLARPRESQSHLPTSRPDQVASALRTSMETIDVLRDESEVSLKVCSEIVQGVMSGVRMSGARIQPAQRLRHRVSRGSPWADAVGAEGDQNHFT